MRNGVLWILETRAQWREIPETYPPYQTCHRRFQQWVRSGALAKALRKLARRLQAEGRLNLEEAFTDATFAAAKKGASGLVLPSVGKGTKITAITVGNSLAVAVSVQAASLHESQLVEEALGHSFLDQLPERLIGDKAYDSDKSDRQMQEQYGVQMIALHRSNRARPTQDGRPLRRYRRRWTVERLLAWLQLFRRLVHALRVPHRQFLGYGPTRMHQNHAEIFLRPPLVSRPTKELTY